MALAIRLRFELMVQIQAMLIVMAMVKQMVKKKQRKRFERLANEHGLFLTGGSDWHGWSRATLGHFFINGEQGDGFLQALRTSAH